MKTSQEFRNAAEINQSATADLFIPSARGATISLFNVGLRASSNFQPEIASNNAMALYDLLLFFGRTSPRPAIVYFPPGRYYLGRPKPMEVMGSRGLLANELLCDFAVPAGVTLKFAPGATLVLVNFALGAALLPSRGMTLLRRGLAGVVAPA